MSVTPYDPRILANKLIDAGVPVVVCRPNPNRGKPSRHGPTKIDDKELLIPTGWSTITAADCDVSGFRPGVDVLAMVGGHGVDAVDVDTKDGGNVKNLPPFRSFGLTRTPSSGWHHYVRSTGVGKISPLRTSAGFVGDYVGGTPDGGGRMLAYLPGSTRPKYPGKAYELVEDLDLDALLEHDPDDDLVGALLAHGGTREGLPGKPAVKLSEVQAFHAEHSEIPDRPCRYGRAAVDGLVHDADAAVPGDPTRGRHGWAVASAARAVELVRAGCATAADLDQLEATLDRVKPEGGTDWGGVLGWALANADGVVRCGIHSPVAVQAGGEDPGAAGGEDPGAAGGEDLGAAGTEAPTLRRVVLTPASTIKMRPVRWAWHQRIPAGAVTLLGGREGVGKSTVGYTLAADVTRGRLPGEHHGEPKAVIVAATEDSWEHTIAPRLMAAGADLGRVFRVDVETYEGVETSISLPRDLAGVEAAVHQVDAALLLLDPLMSRLGAQLDTHKDAEVRLALEPLTALADRTGVAVVGLIHVNKSHSTDPLTTLMASRAFAAVARAVLFVMRDPDDDGTRLLGSPKNNLGRDDLPSLTFRIESAHVADTDEGEIWTGRVHWIGEREQTIHEALEAAGETADARTATGEATGWLLDHLTAEGGTDDSATIKREGVKAGHSKDALLRALKRLKGGTEASGFPRRTFWSLPATRPTVDATGGESTPTALTALTGQTGHPVGAMDAVDAVVASPPRGAPTEPGELAPTECVGCGQTLLLQVAGRDTCARCEREAAS